MKYYIKGSDFTHQNYCKIFNSFYMFNIFKLIKVNNYKFLDPESIYCRKTGIFDWVFPVEGSGHDIDDYVVKKFKGRVIDLAEDIINNGMFAPVYVKPYKNSYKIDEGVHRISSLRIFYYTYGKKSNIKVLSIINNDSSTVDTLITNAYRFCVEGKSIELFKTKKKYELINETINLDRLFLNRIRKEIKDIRPSKFFIDEEKFKKIVGEVDWCKMYTENISRLIIAD